MATQQLHSVNIYVGFELVYSRYMLYFLRNSDFKSKVVPLLISPKVTGKHINTKYVSISSQIEMFNKCICVLNDYMIRGS